MPRYLSRPVVSSSALFAAALTFGAVLVEGAQVASAQSQDAIAEQLNEEGKALMLNRKPDEASKRFADAAARSPNPRYFYNLCKAYHFQGLFFEAMDACDSARKNGPDASLTDKIDELEKLIREAAKEQNIDLSKPPVTPTPDPTQPDPDPTQPNPDPTRPNNPSQPGPVTVRGTPPKNLYDAVKPRHEYVWTLGGEFTGGSSNLGIDKHDDSFSGVRLHVDYMLLSAMQVGAQGYVDFLEISPDGSTADTDKISVANFGGALYKHFCFDRFCVTPLAGLQLGALDNASLGDNKFEVFALGGRAEVDVSVALGTRFEHVIGLHLGALAYAKPGESDEIVFAKGGSLPYVALGYTYRFNTPFGTSPILGLE
jgi:hypothetical protein